MASCHGNTEDHCCYIAGEACPYLEENTLPDRKWVCGLMRKLGDWDLVIASPEYQQDVAPHFDPLGINCRDWPEFPAQAFCGECGYGKS